MTRFVSYLYVSIVALPLRNSPYVPFVEYFSYHAELLTDIPVHEVLSYQHILFSYLIAVVQQLVE